MKIGNINFYNNFYNKAAINLKYNLLIELKKIQI